jgi:hypothetical protein
VDLKYKHIYLYTGLVFICSRPVRKPQVLLALNPFNSSSAQDRREYSIERAQNSKHMVDLYITVAKKHIGHSLSGEFISAGHRPAQFRYRTVGFTRNKIQMGCRGGGGMNRVDGSRFSRYIRKLVWGYVDLRGIAFNDVDLKDVTCNNVGGIQPVQGSIKCQSLQLKGIKLWMP